MKKFAFVFPGQGSQSVGMLTSFAGNAAVEMTVTEASTALSQDMAKLIAEGPAEALGLTTNTQPVMLTAGVAVLRAWRAAGGSQPAVVAGHSLGEYAALVAADVLPFADAVPLVRFRAQAMQEAVPVGVGAMAAILGLETEAVKAVCAEAAQGEVVEAVNFNDPAQTVIAGNKAAVERACELAKSKGAKRALILPVSAPFHSSLMQPAAQRLKDYLTKLSFSMPTIDVINNVDLAVEREPDAIKAALVRQAAGPVRWVETILKMKAEGVTHVVECGPGKVLAGLVKRIDRDLISVALNDAASIETTLELLK